MGKESSYQRTVAGLAKQASELSKLGLKFWHDLGTFITKVHVEKKYGDKTMTSFLHDYNGQSIKKVWPGEAHKAVEFAKTFRASELSRMTKALITWPRLCSIFNMGFKGAAARTIVDKVFRGEVHATALSKYLEDLRTELSPGTAMIRFLNSVANTSEKWLRNYQEIGTELGDGAKHYFGIRGPLGQAITRLDDLVRRMEGMQSTLPKLKAA